MQRNRYAFFTFLCLLTASICQGVDTKPMKKSEGKPPKKPVFTLNVAISPTLWELLNKIRENKVKFVDVIAAKGAAGGGGGIRCPKITYVALHVTKGNDKVRPTPNKVTVERGDCVQWYTKKDTTGDNDSANIDLIDFIDTPGEATASGKPKNATPAGDYCAGYGDTCVVYIALGRGTYTYVAKVAHENKQKQADPELEVSCTGCGEQ